jgi:arylamine N-acetyltransferase
MGTQTLPYSLDQVKAYLALIDLPKRFWPDARPSRDFAMLKALHIHAISTHPYENLSLHYSPSIVVSLKPEHIYEKFMHNGRGGYCFEHGIFFNHILRATGFSAYMVGVRIRMRVDGVPVGDYSGWFVVVPEQYKLPS